MAIPAQTQAQTAAPPPLAAYGELPSVEDVSLAPDGKAMVFVTRIEGKRMLLILGSDKSRNRSLLLGDIKVKGVAWAGSHIVLLTVSSTQDLGPGFTTDKHEFTSVSIINLQSDKKSDFVFKKSPGIVNAIVGGHGVREIDGQQFGFFGGIELYRDPNRGWLFEHGRPALFAVDLETNKADRIGRAASESCWRDWLIDEAGKPAVMLNVNSQNGLWKIENESGKTLAEGKDITGGVDLIGFGKDGDTVIYSVSDDQSGQTTWFEMPLAGGEAKPFLDDVDVKRLYFDRRNGRILGYLADGASNVPVLFDADQQKIMRSIYRAFPGSGTSVVEWTPDFSRVLVHTSGSMDSGTWFFVNMADKRAEPLAYDRMQIPASHVGPVSTVSYTAADGLEMEGILTLPPGREAKNLPVIIFPHGGPHSHDSEGFDWWAQAFASRGYAVFQPNFRGSTNRDEAFRRAGYGEWGRKMQTDLSDGLAELVKQGIADPKRACIMGASYGGYAALAGVTLQQGIYRCAVAVAPVTDMKDDYYRDYRESGGNRMRRASIRESWGDPRTFDEVSPRRFAARADAPILLVHGKDDTVVDFSQTAAMADALKDAGKPYQLEILREEDHNLSHSETRLQMLEAAMQFVQTWNPAD